MNPVLGLLLVSLLGSPSYRERAEAHRALHAAGNAAHPYLWLGRQSADPEISRRCGLLLAGWNDLPRRDVDAERPWPREYPPWPKPMPSERCYP